MIGCRAHILLYFLINKEVVHFYFKSFRDNFHSSQFIKILITLNTHKTHKKCEYATIEWILFKKIMKLLRKKIIFLIFIQFFLLIHLILIFCENLKIKKSIFRSESISHVLFLSHYFQLISKILILFVI